MPPTTIRRAIEAVKDKTSIGIAKLNHRASLLSDLGVAIVKATKHDEYPAEERHINIILNLTCYSRPYMRSCVKTISRRIRRTSNWVVAVKTLMLIHRLLRDGDVAFEHEFLFATRHGSCLLAMSDFRDNSRPNSWNYSVFVRTYALYLNDQLRRKVQNRKGKNGKVSTTRGDSKDKLKPGALVVKGSPVLEMKTEQIFTRMNALMQTLELFLNCRPTGSAKTNRVVVMALYTLIRESFITYYDIAESIGVLMDRFGDLDKKECLKVHQLLCLLSKQFDELDAFYSWSISSGIARSSEYPEVMKVPLAKLDEMEEYIQQKNENEPEPEYEEHNMDSIKALPPPEGFPEEKETEAKIHEVGDLIKFDDEDDAPTTEEDSDKLALCVIDGAPTKEEHSDILALCLINDAPIGPATEPSPWITFNNDSVDWETALEESANSLSNQKETSAWSSDWLMSNYSMHHQQEAVNHKAMEPMLALPAPPVAQTTAANTTMVYPYYAAPVTTTPQPYAQMSEMEMKQKLAMEQQVMWQQYARDGIQGPVAYAMVQPQPYMYNQGAYATTY